jgi:hypothetical protein
MAVPGASGFDTPNLGGRAATAVVALHHQGNGLLMAGWYHSHQTRKNGSAHKLLPIRREDSTPANPPKSDGLGESRVLLVSAYCGSYPEDAEERRRCKSNLHVDERVVSRHDL